MLRWSYLMGVGTTRDVMISASDLQPVENRIINNISKVLPNIFAVWPVKLDMGVENLTFYSAVESFTIAARPHENYAIGLSHFVVSVKCVLMIPNKWHSFW